MLNLSMMSSTAGRVPAARVVEIAGASGCGGIEWINSHGSSGKELRKLVSDAGLKTVAYTMYDESFVNREADYLDRFKEHLEIAVDAEAPHIMIPPFARVNSKGLEEDRKEWIGYFEEIFPLAEAAGIPLTLESTGLPDSPIVSAEEHLEVFRHVPGLKLVFDNGNTFCADDPLNAFQTLLPWIIHVHLKDTYISDVSDGISMKKRNGKYTRQAMIGRGQQDLRTFLKLVSAVGYNRWITLESSDPERKIPITEVLINNISLIRSWEKEGF